MRLGRGSCLASLCVAGLALSAPAMAQTASQTLPDTLAPPAAPAPQAPLRLPAEATMQAPEGAGSVSLTLADITLEGAALAPATMAMLRARLTGKVVTVAEVFAAAGAAEAIEVRRGRVLARVLVPQQDLRDGGTLRLLVVDGFISELDLSAVPARQRGRVAAILQRLVGRPGVGLNEIDRALTLAGELPGLSLRSTLVPGEAEGAVVLRVSGEWRPFSSFVSLENGLPDSLGGVSLSLGVDLRSVLGAGELVYLRASGDPAARGGRGYFGESPRNRALAAGIILPLGTDGLTFTASYSDAKSRLDHAAGEPGFASHFTRLSGQLRYPIIRRRAVTLAAHVTFDAHKETADIVTPSPLPISVDRLRVLRFGFDGASYLANGGAFYADVEASRGIKGLGARTASDATELLPLSRQGADAGFRKLKGSARLDLPLAQHLSLNLNAKGQVSFGEVLVNSEQFGIAGDDAISALSTGVLQGDKGYAARGELRAPFSWSGGGSVASFSPYAFAAHGAVSFEQPTALERKTTRAWAFGAGLRGSVIDPGSGLLFQPAFEYGRAHLPGGWDDRLSVSLMLRF
ncbi:ShlB/FhaC/HecB family hemolysin secretion/activation protein [Aurantiacibacter flavus]|uniref:ShlB/FhaC/HecB family hemolysin secretion/activation protein n=1 Tax=Aurantiacibacter flavus TaxID=3145232 RepID=A0ABV0D1F9_9SPHN